MKQHIQKKSIAEIRILRWLSGYTLKDKIKYSKLKVGSIEDKRRETHLKWFGHV